MKVQYDLEGGQLNRSRWGCSKLVLGAVLLVLLMLGSAFASIWFQRYYWEERQAADKAVQELFTTTDLVEASGTEDYSEEVPKQEVAFFEVNLDENGLSVNVNQDNGSLLSITDASSDLLKEFAGLVLTEAFAAIRSLQEANNAKHVDIPELPPSEASTEEIWSWSTHEGHEGFRLQFDNGEWKFEPISREESGDSEGTVEQSSAGSESRQAASEGVTEEQQTTEANTEEVWSWSSQGINGFRIYFSDGKWSFETVSHESEAESGSDNSEQKIV